MLRTAAPSLPSGQSKIGLLVALVLAGCGPTRSDVGTPMPALVAAGWLGGAPPTAADLHGKVVVIDCWASW